MATHILTSGIERTVAPADGKTFTLAELQSYVGGYIEALELDDKRVMWLNEEGKLKGLPFNRKADQIAHQMTGISPWDQIQGDVLIAAYSETENPEEEE